MIAKTTDPIAFAHPVVVAGIMMPTDVVRLSAGRQYVTDELHASCLFAGAKRSAGWKLRRVHCDLQAAWCAPARQAIATPRRAYDDEACAV